MIEMIRFVWADVGVGSYEHIEKEGFAADKYRAVCHIGGAGKTPDVVRVDGNTTSCR